MFSDFKEQGLLDKKVAALFELGLRLPTKAEMKKTAIWCQNVAKANTLKRTKQRTIADIILKVSLWRQLFNGVSHNGARVRYSLVDSASLVGLTKKSLDDYQLQLRKGKTCDFDFQRNKHEKVGFLRNYVK